MAHIKTDAPTPRRKYSVAGIAIEKGKIFIARRKAGGDLGGKWEFPGGKREAGETDTEALKREYREELGIAVEPGALLASAEFNHNGNIYTLNAYRILLLSHAFTISEHQEWRWAALDEIAKLDFAGSDRLLLPSLEAYLDTEAGVND